MAGGAGLIAAAGADDHLPAELRSGVAARAASRRAADGSGAPFISRVPAVDEAGNDRGGIRLPQIAVPLATHTGWNYRRPEIGAPDRLASEIGSYLPLPRTRADRERTGDSRLSIEERYASKQAYLDRIAAAARELVEAAIRACRGRRRPRRAGGRALRLGHAVNAARQGEVAGALLSVRPSDGVSRPTNERTPQGCLSWGRQASCLGASERRKRVLTAPRCGRRHGPCWR